MFFCNKNNLPSFDEHLKLNLNSPDPNRPERCESTTRDSFVRDVLLSEERTNNERRFRHDDNRSPITISSNCSPSFDTQWENEFTSDKIENCTDSPFRKRHKLTGFDDIKEESSLDSPPISISNDSNYTNCSSALPTTEISAFSNIGMKNFEISYPATPMLSIANCLDLFPCAQAPSQNQSFKTPGEHKDLMPINIQSFNILPSIPSNNATFNIIPQHPKLVPELPTQKSSTIQHYNLIGGSANNICLSTNNVTNQESKSCHMYRFIEPAINIGNEIFNVQAAPIQYTQTFYPNQQFYSIQQTPSTQHTQNSHNNLIAIPQIELNNMLNLTNYQLNPQQISNLLHSNNQLKTSLSKTMPTELICQSNVVSSCGENNDELESSNTTSTTITTTSGYDYYNITKQQQKQQRKIEQGIEVTAANNNFVINKTNHLKFHIKYAPKKNKRISTDRITRSSNRTFQINYKDHNGISLPEVVSNNIKNKKRKSPNTRK